MLWAKALVFALFSLGFVQGESVTLYRTRHKRVYYDCGLQKCVRRRAPPACQRWCLVYYYEGFCMKSKYECCHYKEKPGFCPIDSPRCVWPFPYHSTKAYECHHDFSCPGEFKCCHDSCYRHKVCKSCVIPQETTVIFTKHTEVTIKTTPFVTTTPGVPTTPSTRDTEETTVKTTAEETTTRETTEETTVISTASDVPTTVFTRDTEETTIKTTILSTTEETKPPTIPTVKTTTEELTTEIQTTTDEPEEIGSGIPEPDPARRRRGLIDATDDEDLLEELFSR